MVFLARADGVVVPLLTSLFLRLLLLQALSRATVRVWWFLCTTPPHPAALECNILVSVDG